MTVMQKPADKAFSPKAERFPMPSKLLILQASSGPANRNPHRKGRSHFVGFSGGSKKNRERHSLTLRKTNSKRNSGQSFCLFVFGEPDRFYTVRGRSISTVEYAAGSGAGFPLGQGDQKRCALIGWRRKRKNAGRFFRISGPGKKITWSR
jgi:hypothetical protein